METQKPDMLSDTVDIGLLDASALEFFRSGGGFTGLRHNDKSYPRISLRRVLPSAKPDDYISIADAENKEIGILRSVTELTPEQEILVREELDRRYYCPSVKAVHSVQDKLGYVYLELELDGFRKHCAVRDVNKNIRMLDDDRLIIFDVDGNRYLVPSLSALDKKSLRRLEPYLF